MGIIVIPRCYYCGGTAGISPSIAETASIEMRNVFTVFYQCPSCEGGFSCKVQLVRGVVDESPHTFKGNLNRTKGYIVGPLFPKAADTKVPSSLPPNIENFYRQAADSFQRRNYDAAAVMCGRVLDNATKELDASFDGTLYKRIDNLAKNCTITKDMAEWAHEIRLIRNAGAHDPEPISAEDAKDIFPFTELFLQYVYTLPGKLKERREEEAKEVE